jgi:hypothetical protein
MSKSGMLNAPRLWGFLFAGALLFVTRSASATTPLSALFFTVDITSSLGTLVARPNIIVHDDLNGNLLPLVFPGFSSSTTIRGFLRIPTGLQLLALAPALVLPSKNGNFVATARDVVSFDGASYGIFFNGDDPGNGIPPNANISALTMIGSDLVIALDTTVQLPGVQGTTIIARPRDLIAMTASGPPYSIVFDGGKAGISAGISITAAAYIPTSGHYLMVLDGYGSVGGVSFTPRTILEFSPPADWSTVNYDAEEAMGTAKVTALYAIAATATPTATPTLTPTATPTPTAVPIALGYAPKALKFSTQTLGQTATTSRPAFVRIWNPGKRVKIAVRLKAPILNGPDFAIASNSCPEQIEPDAKPCRIGLTFTPVALGKRTGSLNLVDNAKTSSSQTVTLVGYAVAPKLAARPARLQFGKIKIGKASPAQTVTIINNSRVTIQIGSITVQPVKAENSEFSVLPGQCIGDLPPGQRCPLAVSFTPLVAGRRRAWLEIKDNAAQSPQRVILTGVGR